MTKTTTISTETKANVLPNGNLYNVVVAHAQTYRDNGRGWDIFLDMIDAADITIEEVLGLIGKTKSEFKAKNAIYRYLQPMVAMRRVEDAREKALA